MTLRGLAILLSLPLAGCDSDHTQLYATEPYGPGMDPVAIGALDHMGPTLLDEGVNFAVYSEAAERVELLLFDDPEEDRPAQRFELARIDDGSPVWNLYVEGIGVGQHYGYVAWGPNWRFDEAWAPGTIDGFVADVDAAGNRFNPNKLLLDPWAKAVHRDHDWSRGSSASGPARTQSTWGAAAKNVIIVSDYEWSPLEAAWRTARQDGTLPDHGPNELVVYEVHAKGFTADPSSGVDHPGTFRGVGEHAQYLADLGINAVELLPVMEKPLDGGYWGYSTLSFFAPERTYASDPDPHEVIDEWKQMVDRLHQAGIEVWVDVVYNHTGEGGLWRERIYQDDTSLDPSTDANFYNFDPHETASLLSFRGLDNAAYYALDAGGLTYWNNTGVGNQTRPNHPPMERLILDSLHFYANELHVDGFRFDLAGILGEIDGDFNAWDGANSVLQAIADDPILQSLNVRIVAEPWTAGGNYGALIGAYPAATNAHPIGWGEWNGRYRDWWREFLNDDAKALNSAISNEWNVSADGGFFLTGSSNYYQHNGRKPFHSQNFVTCHDGFTMYDLFSYTQKVNGCGPLNPVCCDDPSSPWCESESGENNNRSRDWGGTPGGEAQKRQMMRNAFVAMMVSHGTPLLLGGDEWMRTQLGNNNAYSTQADNEWNWFQWGNWQQDGERVRMHDFVRQVIALRKGNRHAFAPTEYGGSAPFSWRNETNSGDPNWGSRRLMVHWYDASAGPELVMLLNLERFPVTFTLPTGRLWDRLVDTQRWFDFENPDDGNDFFDQGADPGVSHNASWDEPEAVDSATYGVPENSIVILRAR